MRVELLPSSIPPSHIQHLTSFLVNEVAAIDAGSVGFLADMDRQRRVRHVFITHEHLDHIASLPIFLETAYEPGREPVELLASHDVLEFLHGDIFNGRVWPDFFELSRPGDAFVEATPLEPLAPMERAGLTFTPVPVSHGIDTLGLVVDDGRTAVAFPSDTGPTDAFWRHVAAFRNLKAVFLEASFPAACAELARITGHHSTTTFAEEVRKLGRDVRWIVVHRKARFAGEIERELATFGLPNVEMVQPGFAYEF